MVHTILLISVIDQTKYDRIVPMTDDQRTLTISDLDGRHGHNEDFEPEPLCGGPLSELWPVHSIYHFRSDTDELLYIKHLH